MRKVGRITIGIASLFLCSCTTFNHAVTTDQLQSETEKSFPIHKNYEDKFEVVLSEPKLSFNREKGMVTLAADLAVSSKTEIVTWKGTLKISGIPRTSIPGASIQMHPWHGKDGYFYEIETDSVRLPLPLLALIDLENFSYYREGVFIYKPNVDEIQVSNPEVKFPEDVDRFSHTIANQIQLDVPIYKFADSDFHKMGWTYTPHEVTLDKSSLAISFKHWNPPVCCWNSDRELREGKLLLPNYRGPVLVEE